MNNKYLLYFRARFLSDNIKRTLLSIIVMLFTISIVLYDIIQIRWEASINAEKKMLILTSTFFIAAVACVITLLRYSQSTEYSYLRTIKSPPIFRWYICMCQSFPFVLLYTLISCFCYITPPRFMLLNILHSILIVSALSYQLFILIAKVIVYSSSKLWSKRAILFLGFSGIVALIAKSKIISSRFLIILDTWILKFNLWTFLLSFLTVLFHAYHPFNYEPTHSCMQRSQKIPNVRLYKGVYSNILYKDICCASTNLIIIIAYIATIILALLAIVNKVDGSVCIVMSIILTLLISTLSEEMLKNDMLIIDMIRTLPIKQTTFFLQKILSVVTMTVYSTITFLILTMLFGMYSFAEFILALSITIVLCLALCFMQCMVILKNVDKRDNIQVKLLVMIIIGFFIPPIAMIYVIFRYRKAVKVFCGGRI